MENQLQEECATYDARKAEFLADPYKVGKFMLIKGSTVFGFYDSYVNALEIGYKQYGADEGFMVRQLNEIEPVHVITRFLTGELSFDR